MHTNITVAVIAKVEILIIILLSILIINYTLPAHSIVGVILNFRYPEKILILKN